MVSSVYKSLIAALDKVLRLYDLQEKFLDSDTSNSSVEMRALQIVIDTLVNQTCNWVRLNLILDYNVLMIGEYSSLHLCRLSPWVCVMLAAMHPSPALQNLPR